MGMTGVYAPAKPEQIEAARATKRAELEAKLAEMAARRG